MANLTPEQELINDNHIRHQNNYVRFDADCPECVRQQNWKPPTHTCSHCDDELQINRESIIRHNNYHLEHPESITK